MAHRDPDPQWRIGQAARHRAMNITIGHNVQTNDCNVTRQTSPTSHDLQLETIKNRWPGIVRESHRQSQLLATSPAAEDDQRFTDELTEWDDE